jgi:hypothetical protein
MSKRRHLRQQRRLDVVTGDEQLDGLDPNGRGRVDEILALRNEQPELVAPPPLLQLANELELLVLAGGDQIRVRS